VRKIPLVIIKPVRQIPSFRIK